ncbi:apoptosis-associated speck-like protein containing a CARD [Tautogolabrus adspersus]
MTVVDLLNLLGIWSPKTKKAALTGVLENLSKSNFERFCSQLLDRREEPRVRRSQVEGKNFRDIADVLVSTFTEAGAVKVAVELLKDVNCREEAKELVSNIEPILDQLLERGVIQQESYDTIRALPTSQKKMRALFSSCLKAGAAVKDIFYEILQEYEKFLIDDLKTNH